MVAVDKAALAANKEGKAGFVILNVDVGGLYPYEQKAEQLQ